jgi:hypothetical protein
MKARNRVLELAMMGVLMTGSAAHVVRACGDEEADNEAIVGHWNIYSSEVEGAEDATSRRFPHFKLPHLMDNDAATPWVFRGQGQKSSFEPSWGTRHALQFDHDKPVEVDEIRIMNGYNKRPDLFWRNDRVVEIGIGIDQKKVKTAVLSDKMGWHSVSIPRRKASSLVIEMIGVRKGSGQDNDICISEIAFYNRGKRIR